TYLNSLLLANAIQAIGTLISTQWVVQGAVTPGTLCSIQGGVKQAGNVGAALWSFMLAVHAFNLIFLRVDVSTLAKWITIVVGWLAVVLVVIIGPLAIENKARGPYFGISGYWCWITDEYPAEQTFLEYFFEWLSAFLSFVLYTFSLLRVRGNLIRDINGRWRLRFVPRGESWQLAIGRDMIDAAMVRVASIVVWYPVAYTLLILPITIARFASYAGAQVPTWATLLCDVIFSLSGFVNFMLAIITSRMFPDFRALPHFATPRRGLDNSGPGALGITPFML
ncbi:hypothetical protein DENSPDRAFT_741383, partial [Dentipellis sp. KUC8613]